MEAVGKALGEGVAAAALPPGELWSLFDVSPLPVYAAALAVRGQGWSVRFMGQCGRVAFDSQDYPGFNTFGNIRQCTTVINGRRSAKSGQQILFVEIVLGAVGAGHGPAIAHSNHSRGGRRTPASTKPGPQAAPDGCEALDRIRLRKSHL